MPRTRTGIRRGGFTLIEVLAALMLILVLVGMVLLGAGRLVASSKERATKVTLAALRGMLAEYETRSRFARAPNVWLWRVTTSGTTIGLGANADQNFWIVPHREAAGLRTPLPIDAPGAVFQGAFDDVDMSQTSPEELTRHGSRQVMNTQLAMTLLLQMPANRAALAKLPPQLYFTPRWVMGNIPSPGNDLSNGVLYLDPDATEAIFYPQGAKVTTASGAFICIAPTGIKQSNSAPTAGADWAMDRSPPTPVLLDAWNNPIIFVPGSGLRVRLLNGQSDYKIDMMQCATAVVVSPEGRVDSITDPLNPRVLQPGRPFFASAGPDGDFARGDDNIYSFER